MEATGLLATLLAGTAALGGEPPSRVVRRPPDEIEFTAVVQARAFERGGLPGYHAIVWKDGRASGDALLLADVGDLEVLDALESLGARPANNVPMEAWEERGDDASAAPATVVGGPRVEILLRLPGRSALVPLSDVLAEPAGRGVAMRMGGHRANVPRWRSGCIACLFSCPGGKLGNARYTIRDYVRGATRFGVRPGALPPDGTRVGVVLKLEESRSRNHGHP